MSRIKQRSEDFRVRELLSEGVLGGEGRWRVYQVIKRRLTSIEAAERLAGLAGVQAGEVSMAGMKDRQGITVQHMAVEGGRSPTFGRAGGPGRAVGPRGFGPTQSRCAVFHLEQGHGGQSPS